MDRLVRDWTPGFIRRRQLAKHRQFLQFLCFAMVFDHDRAISTLHWADRCRRDWAQGRDLGDCNEAIGEMLRAVVSDAVRGAGPERTVTLGLSSGFDSRPILRVLWDMGVKPHTYTFGQIGNLDFDVVRLLDDRIRLNNTFIDTSAAHWSLDLFDHASRWLQDLPISPRVLAARLMDTRHPERVDVHGYMNAILTGSGRARFPAADWDEEVRAFARRNDQFGLQELMPPGLVRRLLPSDPCLDRQAMPFHRQLDLGYRLAQRVRPKSGPWHVVVRPFEDRRWVGFWLNRQSDDLVDQRRWIRYVHSLGGDLFFDLTPFRNKESRRDLRRSRLTLVYGETGQPGLVDAQGSGKALPEDPTQHFSLLACYRNNGSFRTMVHSSVARLKARRVFDDSLVDEALSRFASGDPGGSKLINGMVTVDTALEAGVFI